MILKLKQLNSEQFCDHTMDAFETGDRQQTKWLLKKAAKQFPKHAFVPFVEGLMAATIEDYPRAIKSFEKCIARKADHALAHANISVCYKNIQQTNKMLHHALLAVEYVSDEERELVDQQQSLLDHSQKIVPEGLSLTQYVEGGLLFDRAHQHMLDNEPDIAIALFKQVVRIDKTLSSALGNLGTCYLVKGDFKTSRKYLERAINLDPNYLIAQTTLELLEKVENGEVSRPDKIASIDYGPKNRG